MTSAAEQLAACDKQLAATKAEMDTAHNALIPMRLNAVNLDDAGREKLDQLRADYHRLEIVYRDLQRLQNELRVKVEEQRHIGRVNAQKAKADQRARDMADAREMLAGEREGLRASFCRLVRLECIAKGNDPSKFAVESTPAFCRGWFEEGMRDVE